SNQLVLYAPGNDPAQSQIGQFTPAAKLAATRAGAAALAAQLHAPAPLELDVPVSVSVAVPGQPTQNMNGGIVAVGQGRFGGLMFVATPQLLAAYGISPGSLNPRADVLTMRPGLPSTSGLGLINGEFLAGPRNEPCPAGMCILNPVIQEVSKLPSGTSVPNSVITEKAVKALGLGTTVETKSGQLSLGQISNAATIGGLLLALGVLAMTAGLIRSETARDLRTLTATGAGARTRRALAGVTAGVLALLGAA